MIPPKQQSMDERLYWVGFNLVKGIGAVRFQSLLDHFGDAKTAWGASPADLVEAGLGKKVLERFIELRASLDLESYWDQISKQGIRVLIWSDPEYPQHLNEIDQPPPVLYLRGSGVS
jgi:DNA processing protein